VVQYITTGYFFLMSFNLINNELVIFHSMTAHSVTNYTIMWWNVSLGSCTIYWAFSLHSVLQKMDSVRCLYFLIKVISIKYLYWYKCKNRYFMSFFTSLIFISFATVPLGWIYVTDIRFKGVCFFNTQECLSNIQVWVFLSNTQYWMKIWF